mmetsp:Transcript_20465/g.38493  ORF Transcript_20465/g.38493 Transcript_20465/m.38493 type:complete len:90 (-) Transcript_20465:292-561(-)
MYHWIDACMKMMKVAAISSHVVGKHFTMIHGNTLRDSRYSNCRYQLQCSDSQRQQPNFRLLIPVGQCPRGEKRDASIHKILFHHFDTGS